MTLFSQSKFAHSLKAKFLIQPVSSSRQFLDLHIDF